jgi:hypothetical protein
MRGAGTYACEDMVVEKAAVDAPDGDVDLC